MGLAEVVACSDDVLSSKNSGTSMFENYVLCCRIILVFHSGVVLSLDEEVRRALILIGTGCSCVYN